MCWPGLGRVQETKNETSTPLTVIPQVGPGSLFGAGATSETVSQITAIKASQVEVMSIRLKDLMTLVPPSVLKPVADAVVTENQFLRQRCAALASSKNSVGVLAQDGEFSSALHPCAIFSLL